MKRPLFAVCLCIVVLIAILERCGVFAAYYKNSIKKLETIGSITVTGKVSDKEDGAFELRGLTVWNSVTGQPVKKTPGKLIVYCDPLPGSGVKLGAYVTVSGRFRAFSKATNPGEFDFYSDNLSKGVIGSLKSPVLISSSGKYNPILEGLYHTGRIWSERLRKVFPEVEASILCDLLLGDKKGLSPNIRDLYTRNGIAHILSISGLHVSILGMSLYMLLRKTGMPLAVAALIAGFFLFLYGIMTGMSISASRAIWMFLIKLLADITGRTFDYPTALSLCAVILLVPAPGLISSSGFLLSFGSASGLCFLYPVLKTRIASVSEKKNISCSRMARLFLTGLNRIGDMLLVSLSITLTTLPIVLWFFFEYPTYQTLLNLIVLPLMTLLMMSGLLAMLIPGGGLLGSPAFLILKLYENLCIAFDRLPFHTWNPGRPHVVCIVIYYLIWLTVVISPSFSGSGISKKISASSFFPSFSGAEFSKKISGSGFFPSFSGSGISQLISVFLRKFYVNIIRITAAVLIPAPLLFTIPVLQPNTFIMLDVGQGDSFILCTDSNEVFLFDGGSSSSSSVGKYVIKPALKYYGISGIRAAFVSHPDSDHCNGLIELLENRENWGIKIENIVLPDCANTRYLYAEDQTGAVTDEYPDEMNFEKMIALCRDPAYGKDIPVSFVSAGDTLKSGSTVMTCLHPSRSFLAGDPNEMSECFLIQLYRDKEMEADPAMFSSPVPSPSPLSSTAPSILLTGDVQGDGEKELTENLRKMLEGRYAGSGSGSGADIQTPAEAVLPGLILKVAHHGSRYSTPDSLLSVTAPAVALISAGSNNRYGHPHREVLERLQKYDPLILNTQTSGAVIIRPGYAFSSWRAKAWIQSALK